MIDFNQQHEPSSLLDRINQLEDEELFSRLDIELACAALSKLNNLPAPARNWIAVACAQCHRMMRMGHTSIDLTQTQPPPHILQNWPDNEYWESNLGWTNFNELQQYFHYVSPKYLYLRRMWISENELAKKILAFSTAPKGTSEDCTPKTEALIAGCSEQQKRAIQATADHSFILLSGGPGTGKTFTVLRSIIGILLRNPEAEIALTAPTGKAVARLIESINNGLADIELDGEIKAKVPKSAETIHRFLMGREKSNKLELTPFPRQPIDWLFVDEVSMVDLSLMNRLLSTLDPETKVFMLGDIHQLASVQPGSVFADIYKSIQNHQTNHGWVSIELTESHRFKTDTPIYQLCEATKEGDIATVRKVLSQQHPDTRWFEPNDETIQKNLHALFESKILNAATEVEPQKAMEKFKRLLILSAVNKGKSGVELINLQLLRRIQRSCAQNEISNFWAPIIITTNDYQLSLFNGDLALQRRSTHTGQASGSSFYEKEEKLHEINSSQLPPHNLAFCLSIHKSQGSEANEVLLILPEKESPILNRELFYTAISRAKTKLSIISPMDSIQKAVSTPTQRTSRLKYQISEQ